MLRITWIRGVQRRQSKPTAAPTALKETALLTGASGSGSASRSAGCCSAPIYISSSIGWSEIGDQPAEVIGNFLEGAFAPLAFLWLVIGYFLQQKELSQNTEALRQQFREIERTAEQAVKQTETISAQERHARRQIFLQVHELVRRQLGAIAGMLWISSQGPGEDGSTVSDEEQAELWTQLNQGDPDVSAVASSICTSSPSASKIASTSSTARKYGRGIRTT